MFTYKYYSKEFYIDGNETKIDRDIVLIPDKMYDEKISLKKLIFDATFDGNRYLLVFEKNNLPSEEKLRCFIHTMRKYMMVDQVSIAVKKYCGYDIKITDEHYPLEFLGAAINVYDSYGEYYINSLDNEIGIVYFEVSKESPVNDYNVGCFMRYLPTAIIGRYFVTNDEEKCFFINFNNIEIDC